MNIALKSVATLIDELITTDLKCYMEQEIVMTEIDSEKIAKASKSAQELNKRRNLLIQAIDEQLKLDTLSPTKKSY